MSSNIPATMVHRSNSGAEYVHRGGGLFSRMSNTGGSSARFGACHLCGKHADTVYRLSFAIAFVYDELDAEDIGVEAGSYGLTYHKAPPEVWGHMSCLEDRCAATAAAWKEAQ